MTDSAKPPEVPDTTSASSTPSPTLLATLSPLQRELVLALAHTGLLQVKPTSLVTSETPQPDKVAPTTLAQPTKLEPPQEVVMSPEPVTDNMPPSNTNPGRTPEKPQDVSPTARPSPQVQITLSPDDWVLVQHCLLELGFMLKTDVPGRGEYGETQDQRLLQDIERVGHSINLAGYHSLSEYDDEYSTSELMVAMMREDYTRLRIGDAVLSRKTWYSREGTIRVLSLLEKYLPQLSSQNDWEGLGRIVAEWKDVQGKLDFSAFVSLY